MSLGFFSPGPPSSCKLIPLAVVMLAVLVSVAMLAVVVSPAVVKLVVVCVCEVALSSPKCGRNPSVVSCLSTPSVNQLKSSVQNLSQ